MDFTMNYYLRFSWTDPRLSFDKRRKAILLETTDVIGNLVFVMFEGAMSGVRIILKRPLSSHTINGTWLTNTAYEDNANS